MREPLRRLYTLEVLSKIGIAAYLMIYLQCFMRNSVSGYQMYNSANETCCNGTVAALNGSASACCGNSFYDPGQSKCCMDRVVPLPEEPGFRHGCCVGLEGGNVSAFNFDSHVCCDGALLRKPDRNASYSCHKGQLFDNALFMACGNGTLERQPGKGCCVNEPFDFENETCCVHVDRSNGTTDYRVYAKPHPGQRCCGAGLFDQTEMCCDGRVRPKPEGAAVGFCCGDSVIANYTLEICCNGKVLARPSENHTCCEDAVYDFNRETCCGGAILQEGGGRSCCFGAGRAYDGRTEICCHSEVVPVDPGSIASGNSSCCAAEAASHISSFARMNL